MHYGARSFGQRNPRTGVKLTTIELVNAFAERNGKMGQRLALSLIDIQQVNMLYRCNKEGTVTLPTLTLLTLLVYHLQSASDC